MPDRIIFTLFAILGTLVIAGALLNCGTVFAIDMGIIFLAGGAALPWLINVTTWGCRDADDRCQNQEDQLHKLEWPEVDANALSVGDLIVTPGQVSTLYAPGHQHADETPVRPR